MAKKYLKPFIQIGYVQNDFLMSSIEFGFTEDWFATDEEVSQ